MEVYVLTTAFCNLDGVSTKVDLFATYKEAKEAMNKDFKSYKEDYESALAEDSFDYDEPDGDSCCIYQLSDIDSVTMEIHKREFTTTIKMKI